MAALRAWLTGLWRLVRAPILLISVYGLTLALTVPLGVVLHNSLPYPADVIYAEPQSGLPADLDWLDEVTSHAGGLLATLSPAAIGVAAPLSNLDALLEGQRPPLPIMLLSGGYFVMWAWLWGGVTRRLARARGLGARAFAAASRRSWLVVIKLAAMGLAGYLLIFSIHAALFEPAFAAVTGGVLERTAFAWRAALSLLFVLVLAAWGQVLDYARIYAVLEGVDDARGSLRHGIAFVRQRPATVAMLLLINAVLFAALLAAYGAVEFVPGGSVPRLSRVVIIGQAFILARVALRLLFAASQVSLYSQAAPLRQQGVEHAAG